MTDKDSFGFGLRLRFGLRSEERGKEYIAICEEEEGLEKLLLNRETTSLEDVNVLTDLRQLHKSVLLETCKVRFSKDTIHTWVDRSILLILNPFKPLPSTYTPSVMSTIKTSVLSSLHSSKNISKTTPPHVFSISTTAFYACLNTSKNQSILISGESGSGKTVSTSLCLDNLIYLSSSDCGNVSSLTSSIKSVTKVLESYGNCRTVRNDNSSRFGKLICLSYNKGKIMTSKIETYLLEKIRVLGGKSSERNFNVFYEWCSYNEKDAESYKILHGAKGRRDGVSDLDMYGRCCDGFNELGLDGRVPVSNVLEGILLLGNVGEGLGGYEDVAGMWEVEGGRFKDLLVNRYITVGGETFKKELEANAVVKAIEGVIMSVYGAVFVDIVNEINECLEVKGSHTSSEGEQESLIALLDIFGFENFDTNGFTQLMINFCNERLQRMFNEHVFRLEEEEYEREGIEWGNIVWESNENVLKLIEGQRGVLKLLDETGLLPQANDSTFYQNLVKTVGSHDNFSTTKKGLSSNKFQVKHYAGQVEYTCDGFVESNKDEVPRGLVKLFEESSNTYIQRLASRMKVYFDDKRGRRGSIVNRSVGSQFCRQLQNLSSVIQTTSPNYIRCVKVNDNLVPSEFNESRVEEQLRCGGVLEAVRVGRLGYPNRIKTEEFKERYKAVYDGKAEEIIGVVVREFYGEGGRGEGEGEGKFFQRFGYQVGRTKVFMKGKAYEEIEEFRRRKLGVKATMMQKFWRMSKARKEYLRTLAAVLLIQVRIRMLLSRVRVSAIRRDHNAKIIQRNARMAASRFRFARVLKAAKFAQSWVRMKGVRRGYVEGRRNGLAVRLQGAWRRSVRRGAYLKFRGAVVGLQGRHRKGEAKKVLKAMRVEARSVDKIRRERDELKEKLGQERREMELLRAEMERLRAESNATVVTTVVTQPPEQQQQQQQPPPPPPQQEPKTPPTNATTNSNATPDHSALALEASTLRKEKLALEARVAHAEALLASPPPAIDFSSPIHMTMVRSVDTPTPIHHYYASSAKTENQSALHFAVLQNDVESVKIMLEGNIPDGLEPSNDVNANNHDQRTPLHLAVINSAYQIASLLVEAKAATNAQDRNGDTALHLSRSASITSLLLTLGGANPNIPNSLGHTPLHIATKNEDLASASYLLKNGADINAIDDKNWRTPVFDIAFRCNLPMLRLLCESSLEKPNTSGIANLNLQAADRYGYTPLHHLANSNLGASAVDFLFTMLQHGADPNAKDKHGFSPLHLLCNNKVARGTGMGYEMIKLMLEQGGEPTLQAKDGCTPLHLALYHTDYDSSNLLMAAGASLTLPWKFPSSSKSLKRWWDEENQPPRPHVLPLDMAGSDHRVLHFLLEAITKPQLWVDDRQECMQCKLEFSFMERRHHCRHCGRLCCSKCSTGQLDASLFPPLIRGILVESGAEKHRVCMICEDILESRASKEHKIANASSTVDSEDGDDDGSRESWVNSGIRQSTVLGGRKEEGFPGSPKSNGAAAATTIDRKSSFVSSV
ncbi:hypothetical protein TrST_g693 [Triparma strigata]|uniref:Uncharacterized protein n=1 Tax=Triparma strigata TaxID=1606541 RepID=A0A9W7EMS2_9STRA|nr:hypothetical protein TrST_g693 [Triparma strigata]